MPNLRLQGSIYAVLWNKYPFMDRFMKPNKLLHTNKKGQPKLPFGNDLIIH